MHYGALVTRAQGLLPTVREVLGPDSALSRVLSGYEVREGQLRMAEAAERGRESPQPGIPAAAVVAAVVVDADEVAARRAHHGTRGLTLEHPPQNNMHPLS